MLSTFLKQTELMRVKSRVRFGQGQHAGQRALLNYSHVRDPVNVVVRGKIKLSNATLRCANITNTVPQAYPRSSGTVPENRH